MTTRLPVLPLAALLLAAAGAPLAAQTVAEVQVAPPSISIKVGERYGLLATAYDRLGNVLPAAKVIWTSNNVQVARVDNTGTVVGVAPGVAIVEARAGQRRGQAAVQVAAAAAPATGTGAGSGTRRCGRPPIRSRGSRPAPAPRPCCASILRRCTCSPPRTRACRRARCARTAHPPLRCRWPGNHCARISRAWTRTASSWRSPRGRARCR